MANVGLRIGKIRGLEFLERTQDEGEGKCQTGHIFLLKRRDPKLSGIYTNGDYCR